MRLSEADGPPLPTAISASTARPTLRRVALAAPRLPLLLVGSFGLFIVVGALLVFGAASVPIDTWARVGNAFYVLFSRDPHLGAIGFVLPPVPTLAILPIIPLQVIWPALASSAFAATITSAAFMAGAVVLLRRILLELAVPRPIASAGAILFALHPMILYYGANGLTEAAFVFSLMWGTLALVRWLDRDRPGDLAQLALALAIGYLTRYEFLAAVAAAVAVVAAVSYIRAPMGSGRAAHAAADASIAGLPFALAFVGWALTGWLLVGSPFAQFTSIYGNSSQLGILRASVVAQTGQGTAAAFGYVASQLLGLAPALPVLGAIALARAAQRVDHRVLAPLAVIGGPLGFSVIAFLTGSTVGFLRYEIAVVPLMFVGGGFVLARNGHRPLRVAGWSRLWRRNRGARPDPNDHSADVTPVDVRSPRRPSASTPTWRRGARVVLAGVTAMAVLYSFPTSVATLRHPILAREEADALRGILGNEPPSANASYVLATRVEAGRVAAALDSLNLPKGSVLLDVAIGNAIVLQSKAPQQFVITTDRDFERVLADPATFAIQYLVVADPSGEGALDALNRVYPRLYEDGGGFATLVREFDKPSPGWRLYRMTETQ
ncbi:MAG: hypothetical protein QOF49_205 [Chloroflexota bacterium]|nr:hypothetical protein [Chloroflexota bacterium]